MGFGDWLSSHPLPPFILGLIIGIPSVILYVIEVIILLKHWRQLNSAFFRLFLVRFTLNFLNFFCSYMYARFGRVGWFYELFSSSPSVLLAFWFTFYYYAFHAENLSNMFLIINRLTSIMFPARHLKIWKYMLPISIVLILVLPLPFTAPMITYKFFTRLQADNYTFTLSFLSDENDLSIAPNVLGVKYLNPSTVAAFSAALFFIVCGTLNVFTIVLYNLHGRQSFA
ncbi:srg family chemoreceptor domain-containing protein [Ditylenchus destructor]|nr:srg family chemoreceptor domain-containing protein [Ditylenchus destructor]